MHTVPHVTQKPRILLAALNWGLGHATRCIPLILALEEHGFEVVLASDGAARQLWIEEFPHLRVFELPAYHISYAAKRGHFKRHLIGQIPRMFRAVQSEQKTVAVWHRVNPFVGIISDNRPGVWLKGVPTVYLTHQLRVLSGSTTWLSTFIHRVYMKRFDAWWVPDVAETPNLSGVMGHIGAHSKTNYLGPISRLNRMEAHLLLYDVLVLLSGPEPARTQLEKTLLPMAVRSSQRILFVRGVIGTTANRVWEKNVEIVDYLTSTAIGEAINQSRMVLSRSGYSTVMDLAAIGCKQCFFIPTPGQYEQEYLAEKLHSDGVAPFARQEDFKWEMLDATANFTGFTREYSLSNWSDLFCLFDGKGKL